MFSLVLSYPRPKDGGAVPGNLEHLAGVPPSAPNTVLVRTERDVRTRTSDTASSTQLPSRDVSQATLALPPSLLLPLREVARHHSPLPGSAVVDANVARDGRDKDLDQVPGGYA